MKPAAKAAPKQSAAKTKPKAAATPKNKAAVSTPKASDGPGDKSRKRPLQSKAKHPAKASEGS